MTGYITDVGAELVLSGLGCSKLRFVISLVGNECDTLLVGVAAEFSVLSGHLKQSITESAFWIGTVA